VEIVSLCWWLFPLLYRKLLIWSNSVCQFLLLFSEQLESYSERHLLCLYTGISPRFSSSYFKVSSLTFRSLIHLQSIFVQDDKLGSSFRLLYTFTFCFWYLLFTAPFDEGGFLFSNMHFSHLCWKSYNFSGVGLFLLYSMVYHAVFCYCGL
jgi:hypothetical protein